MGLAKIKYNQEHFRVLAIFSKDYNKWFCIKEEKIEWHQNYAKGKYRVLARQISGSKHIKDVEINTDQIGYKAKDVLVMKDVNQIMGIHGVLG